MKVNIIRNLMTVVAGATALLSLASPGKAVSLLPGETFGTTGLKFVENTEVKFSFIQSNGAFQSTLQLFEVGPGNTLTLVKNLFAETKGSDNGQAGGWLGTCGNTVLTCTSYYTFQANKTYTLALNSGVNGTVYSTSGLNTASGGSQQAVFNSFGSQGQPDETPFPAANASQFQAGDPLAMTVKIGIDDRGNGNDRDFQDFTVTSLGNRLAQSVPEPTTMAGLALTAGALAFSRRRRMGKV